MRPVVLLTLLFGVAACGGGPTPPDQPNLDDVIRGACGYSVRRGDTARTVGPGGGALRVQVTTTAGSSSVGCNWTVAMSDAARSFMTLVDPVSGSSSAAQATVTLDVSANAGGQRQATVTIADVPFTITQTAAPCTLALSGDVNATFPASGGTGRVAITRTQGASCAWTATSNAPFITAVTPANGSDDGSVTFAVAANTGQARTGTLTIAGQTVTVNQAGVNVVVPTIAGVTPATLSLAVTTTVTINGTGFDPATAQIVVTGPACAVASPCVVTNGELTTRTPTQLIGPMTLRNPGIFTVQVQNGSGGPLSNGATVTVIAVPTAPPVINMLTPTQMTVGTQVLTITGSGFDPPSAQIVVTGLACAPCVIPNADLTTRTVTQIAAPATLLNAGAFTIQVQNGSTGPLSNGVTLTVVPPRTPSIANISPTVISVGVQTSLTITGADFDPASAQIVVVGGGCSAATPCVVPNSDLTTRSSSQIVGPVTLRTTGSFTIQIQNGSAGGLSNAVAVTVR